MSMDVKRALRIGYRYEFKPLALWAADHLCELRQMMRLGARRYRPALRSDFRRTMRRRETSSLRRFYLR
jgi:hypothetical protein